MSWIPAHACTPPVPRNDPEFRKAIQVGIHGYPEEVELVNDIKHFLGEREDQLVTVREMRMRDADWYLVVNIGIGIAANLVTDLIKFLAGKLREQRQDNRKPVIYIAPAYAPKRVFKLPDHEAEVLEYFKRHPSRRFEWFRARVK